MITFVFLARLAEELRTEQEHGLASDKALKILSSQSLELQSRLEDVETTALRHGRKIVSKLEERTRALESELCKYRQIFRLCLQAQPLQIVIVVSRHVVLSSVSTF